VRGGSSQYESSKRPQGAALQFLRLKLILFLRRFRESDGKDFHG
jgi:hypothetical protein